MKMKIDMKKEVTKLQKKVSKWTKEWVADETNIELFRDEPPTSLGAYIEGKEDSPSIVDVKSIHLWHFVHYMNAVLNEGKDGLEDFALAARYARAVVMFEDAFVKAGFGGAMLEYNAVFYLSLNILSGWKMEANTIGYTLYNGLDTRLLDLRHNERHSAGELWRHFWFMMHLNGEIALLKRKIDTSLYSYPEDMEPYTSVLADWQTKDTAKVQKFVSAMADFHIQETKATAHDEIDEFDTEDRMIFPYEILSYLRIREWQGLPNPETFDHPLMNQPLAKLPNPVPLKQPETPLLDKVIERFKKEYPESFASWK